MLEAWPVIKGLLTRVPGLYRTRAAAYGGTISARYCYSVWLRHLVSLRDVGMRRVPHAVAELGPGLSLGVGLAALLSGTDHYFALDVSRDASPERHANLLDDLATLFADRAPIPDDAEFPDVLPRLPNYQWPAWLDVPALPLRLESVRGLLDGIRHGSARSGELLLDYQVPWMNDPGRCAVVDLVMAQAVLEHVHDPRQVYVALASRLRPGGHFSFTIDFRSHGLTRAGNGHWAYSSQAWRTVEGARPWGLNRWTLSQHLAALREASFTVLRVDRERRESQVKHDELDSAFRAMDPADLETCSAYVAAVKAGA